MKIKKNKLTFKGLQQEQKAWIRHNFPNRDTYMPLLGAIEEIGELAELDPNDKHLFELFKSLAKISHHHLKKEQKIRVSVNHDAKIKDGIADCIVFLADYATAKGVDLQEAVEETWSEVRKRDWKKFPKNGRTE